MKTFQKNAASLVAKRQAAKALRNADVTIHANDLDCVASDNNFQWFGVASNGQEIHFWDTQMDAIFDVDDNDADLFILKHGATITKEGAVFAPREGANLPYYKAQRAKLANKKD